jgi:hypothetical protein
MLKKGEVEYIDAELYIECCACIFSDVELIHEEMTFSGSLACTRYLAI